ncbi:VOC family protein [Microbacterium sp. STN6]|uniref:VOC family protein n=1 Tax=Microbacterium sp. STN6 TaxID=2995588 RepID=UPI0022609E2F|nr:VOC family protein [Microbacterium sp. STN6]MCX7521544.1 VOC family protein [Microbacterium sp. STN6]
MTVTLNPYLAFRDTAREAMEFYRSVLGGELKLATFSDFGMSSDPADADLIMHGFLTSDDGLVIMASDTPSSMEWAPRGGDSIALGGDDEETLRGFWNGLSDGAEVREPLAAAPWGSGDIFGMLTDRFGVNWMVSISQR